MTIYAKLDSPMGELLLVGEESETATGGASGGLERKRRLLDLENVHRAA